MKKLILLAGLLGSTFPLQADLTHDAEIVSNVIYGDGNTDGGWTIFTEGSLELALRGKVRYDPVTNGPKNVFTNDSNGNFFFPAGAPTSNPDRARWNFDFSVNSNTDDNGGNLDTFKYFLGIDFDPGAGTNFLELELSDGLSGTIFDNSYGNNSTTDNNDVTGPFSDFTYEAVDYNGLGDEYNVMQNSRNMAFHDDLTYTFDPNALGTYSFYLEARDLSDNFVGRTEITINAVPEPSVLLGTIASCAIGLIAFRRRRKAA